ncbi:hypothetical protein D9758_009170 [Tetrapyrgos nigripes]|uniref:RING-type domain-containing protein n=1 Tax=Tetrapyrgos nigripes TaxID=182062 RepID=A0A8H5G8E9_9AGAR|nr:hypothetical protein D9758_009170 [Tetrapyrgos nigripes]
MAYRMHTELELRLLAFIYHHLGSSEIYPKPYTYISCPPSTSSRFLCFPTMLSLLPGSCCDVCAEEYGPHTLPHSIACGHVLCSRCCDTIIEKTSPRHSPACPFCREQFTSDNVRLIRTDFSSSGWNTPRRLPTPLPLADSVADLWSRREEKILLGSEGRPRDEARRLEDKVARIASKKCSVEEVSTLHQELEAWLKSPVKNGDQSSSSLHLSAALLRAILMNHVVHTEASKTAKNLEATLKGKIDDLEIKNGKLEAELRHKLIFVDVDRQDFNQKAQECQSLRTELTRLKVVATTLGTPSPSSTPDTAARSRAMSPPPPSSTPAPPSLTSPSRFGSLHMRSASMHASSRPSTPATSPTHSSVRSHTPSVPLRSQTPAIPSRLATATPSPMNLRAQTPGPPIPPKPRRLSTPSPPQMARSVSEEKQQAYQIHERWIPPGDHPVKPATPAPPMQRSTSRASDAAYPKLRGMRSPSPGYY